MERYSEYKDSGVQWLGEIPSHWTLLRNKAFMRITDEKVGKRKDVTLLSLTKQGVIVRDLSEGKGKFPKDFDAYLVVRPDNLVFCLFDIDETPRTVGLVKNVGMLTGAYTNFEINKKLVLPEYAYYYYLQVDDVKGLRPYYTGLRKVVKTNTFSQLRMPLPPLTEQQAIVSYLDVKCSKLDTLVENKEKEISLLSEMKQRIIADAVTRGLNPNVKFKRSNIPWLPEIPEYWEEKRLSSKFVGDVDVNKGFVYKHAFKFNYGELVPKNETGDSEEYRDTYIKYSLIKKGDILINGLNLNYDFVSQRVACAPNDGIITSAYLVCRPRKGVYYNYYTYLFKAMDGMKLFHGMGSGIRLTLSFKELKKQMLTVPPLSEQQAIVSYITERTAKIDSLIEKLNKEIECIKEYKQRLISDVVTGQIKVS
mgnify:CR=1 FL=1